MKTSNNTIVYFHIGRGGKFNNSGYKSFCGTKNMIEVFAMNDSGKNWTFINRENASEVRRLLEDRGLENLLSLFEKCSDNDNDFAEFEKRTGLKLGELYYTNGSGDCLISVAEAETGVGRIVWDGDYDTDICMTLADCDRQDIYLIAKSNEWNKEDLLKCYFDNETDLQIDWSRFDGRFEDLIEEYFDFPTLDIEDYYTENE